MDKYVVSLETAKKLKECGFPQRNTHWLWYTNGDTADLIEQVDNMRPMEHKSFDAPIAEEILERLPREMKNKFHVGERGVLYWLEIETMSDGKGWACQYRNPNFGVVHFEEDKFLAEASAKMYIYLSENNLLPEKEGE